MGIQYMRIKLEHFQKAKNRALLSIEKRDFASIEVETDPIPGLIGKANPTRGNYAGGITILEEK